MSHRDSNVFCVGTNRKTNVIGKNDSDSLKIRVYTNIMLKKIIYSRSPLKRYTLFRIAFNRRIGMFHLFKNVRIFGFVKEFHANFFFFFYILNRHARLLDVPVVIIVLPVNGVKNVFAAVRSLDLSIRIARSPIAIASSSFLQSLAHDDTVIKCGCISFFLFSTITHIKPSTPNDSRFHLYYWHHRCRAVVVVVHDPLPRHSIAI